MRIVFTQMLVFLLFTCASAQGYRLRGVGYTSSWEIGISTGVSSFLTSLSPTTALNYNKFNYWHNNANPGIAIAVVRNFSPSLGIEMNWLNTRLDGRWNDIFPLPSISGGHQIPLTYNSQINQIDLMAAFNLNQIMLPGDAEDVWHLFMKTGFGMTQIIDKKKFYPDGSSYIKLSYALDAGISVSLNEKIKLMLGSTFRSVTTDNLDGVHVVSKDLNGKEVAVMNIFEIYNFTYLRLNYNLGKIGF